MVLNEKQCNLLFHNGAKCFCLIETRYDLLALFSFLVASTDNFPMGITAQLLKKLKPRSLRNKWLSFVLRGKEVECPCCNRQFITFLPAGLQKRANAQCVNCGSLERHRIIWMYLKKETGFFTSSLKVLNPAPEKLFYTKLRTMSNIEYTSIDLYPEKYDYGSKTIKMDLTDLQFVENSFDVVLCNHVLEHIPNDAKAISEMYRVLNKDGWAIINVPVDHTRETTFEDLTIDNPQQQLELFGQPDHVRVYGKDYVNRLKHAGFTVEVIDYAERFTHNEMFKYGMLKGREIYLCTKK